MANDIARQLEELKRDMLNESNTLKQKEGERERLIAESNQKAQEIKTSEGKIKVLDAEIRKLKGEQDKSNHQLQELQKELSAIASSSKK